ncbi:hypothetical protein BGW39_008705 [Mortierella sp. 14UC]|nr:hypothetical protein BGW39_008705 [Mortierella sp. 14UC]
MSPQQPLFPEPIVFQYVLYYPGNLPLVITAGHGGSAQPGEVLTRKRTHRLRRIPELATMTDPIEISSFAEPLYPPSSLTQSDLAAAMIASLSNSGDETMPSMTPRDQTKGGNFKKDLNTHSIALNLANAISCLTSGVGGGGGASSGPGGVIATPDGTSTGGGPFSTRTRAAAGAPNGSGYGEARSDDVAHMIATAAFSATATTATTDHGTNAIPARCEQQGPWGDDDSDYPFPTWSSRASTPIPTPTPPTGAQPQQQQQDPTRRLYQKQAQNYPHVVVFRIPRQFVDVNRNITGENAIAEGDVHAEAAWREYHDLIDHVQKMALQKAAISVNQHRQQEQEHERKSSRESSHWTPPQAPAPGRGLLLDIHGHAHATNLIEIGYLLNGTVLNMDDDRLNAYGARLTKESSIRSLINKVVSPSTFPVDSSALLQQGVQFSKLVRGGRTESLGGMFQAQGLNAVPSPDFQAPCQECIYFFGGYTIQRHGSRNHKDSDLANNDTMDAIQLELPKILRLVDKEQGREVGMKLGRAVVDFAAQYYGLFRESPAIVAREQSDAVVMAAMAKGALSSRSGSSTPRRGGATSSGRGGGRIGGAGSSAGGGVAGQMVHSTRLQERLARIHHSHNRVPQQQHLHHHQPQALQQQQPGADPSVSVASSSSNNVLDGWDQQSGDSNQSGDSEMENDREKRRPEIKRQASRL